LIRHEPNETRHSQKGSTKGLPSFGVLDWQSELVQKASTFFMTPPKKANFKRPHLALMLFVRDYVPEAHAKLWTAWMDAAKSQGLPVGMYIHTGLTDLSNFSTDLKPYVIKQRVKTDWCQAYGAIMAMYKHVRRHKHVTHVATISDDSIPVQPLSQIYADILAKPQSRFCQDNNWWIPRAETWWVMSRQDMELFHNNKYDLFLTLQRNWEKFHINDCDDENFWYLPLRMRGVQWGDDAKVLNKCSMYTNWAYTDFSAGSFPCKEWANHAGGCECDNLDKDVFAHADTSHPAKYANISASGFLDLLVSSNFWFARKVVDGLQPEAFALAQEVWHGNDTSLRKYIEQRKATSSA
jgi:hypothetical protein